MGHKKLVTKDPSQQYPAFLKKITEPKNISRTLDQPTLIDMSYPKSASKLEELISANKNLEIIDNYAEQYAELLLSKHAHLYQANYEVQVSSISGMLDEHYDGQQPWKKGSWVFYPWSNQLVHVLAQEDFETLRTIRNRNLITSKEQKKLYDLSAVCFGMSVGSAGAQVMALTGMSRQIKLVDGAVISGSNLNRIMTGVASVGRSKASTIGHQIYEMNPYSSVMTYDKVTSENIADIFDKPWEVNLAIDEIDDIEMKVHIRNEARKRHVPVLMATEVGDTIILDVERFDLEPNRPLFHGRVPGLEKLLTSKITDYREWTKHAVGIIDPSNMSVKMQKSLLKIGTNIVTHPQLGSTVMMTGGMLAFAAKSIALDNPLKSGRYVISLEREMLADHKTRHYKRKHKKHTKVIRSAVGSM